MELGTAVGIASFGIQICQGLLRYYDAWKGYDSDISSAYESITDLSKTLTLLKGTLEQEVDIERVKRVDTCVKSCEDALWGLENKRRSLQNYSQPEGLRQRMLSGLQRSWYPFRKETLQALKITISDVQKRLELALQVLQLEIGTESQGLVLRVLSQISTQGDSIEGIAAQSQLILDTQRSEEFRKIVAWVAPPDPGTNHATARQRHENKTGGWLLMSTLYQSWKAGAVSHLWMYGKAGCGKTILFSTAIEDIRDACEHDPDVSHAFFYFTFSDEHKQSDWDLLRSLVAQLGWREPGLSMLRQAYGNSRQNVPGPDELQKILLASVRSCSRVYLLMDALDECPEDDGTRQNVLERIERLTQQAPNISVFATSREVDKIRKAMERLGPEPLRMIAPEVDADIRVWLSTQMSRDSNIRELSPELQTLIESTISSQADGMFRWAYCQLQELKSLDSFKPKFVKQALKTLPTDLDATYTQMLTRIKEMYHQEAFTLLRWLAYARSPPTLAELVDAAITDPGQESSVDTDERGGLRDVLRILSGLVTIEENQDVDEKSRRKADSLIQDAPTAGNDQGDTLTRDPSLTPQTRVKLAHFSVKEFLESERILTSEACRFHMESVKGQSFLAQSCLTYLLHYSVSSEKASNASDLETFPLLQYAAESWFHHSLLQLQTTVGLEIPFLMSKRAIIDWISIYYPDDPSQKPFEIYGEASSGLYYASALGLENVVSGLLSAGSSINIQSGYYGSPLAAASYFGHTKVARMLLANGADVQILGGEYGNALQAASFQGHTNVVQLLLEKYADINAKGGFYGNALYASACEGHVETVQLLLERGADVNAHGGYYGNALQAAARRGFAAVVQTLLEWRANVDAEGGYYGNALQAASFEGHTKMVQLLLSEDANVNAQGGHFRNALQAASWSGHKEVVRLLLDSGADVNAQGGYCGNALQAASEGGHKEVLQLLQTAGARILSVESDF